jgi:hypothetical protein
MTPADVLPSAEAAGTTAEAAGMTGYPEPSFAHLVRLSDDTGLMEHARGTVALRDHGYCVDDVARVLLVICREPAPAPELLDLAERYQSFLMHAQVRDGTFHNRLDYSRRWLDQADTGDWWGRAIWGLGTVVARAPRHWMRHAAFGSFELAAHHRSRWPRAMAFAGLGAAEVLRAVPDHGGARHLLADAVVTVGRPGTDPEWPWPEPRLTYANAALAEVHLAAGQYLDDDRAAATGLRMLGWLLDVETWHGHLSTTPVGGWVTGEPRPGFDQQPIEAAAMADACGRAWALTGEQRWAHGLRMAIGWFLGDNDSKVELMDSDTGGGRDGLGPSGSNENEGAESTLALLSTLQHARNIPKQPHGN